MNDLKQEAIKELAIRQLERKHKDKQDDLVEFMKFYFKEETPKGIPELVVDDYIYIIAEHLMQVQEGKISRLVVNIPP